MKSVNKIETEISKLPADAQREIARHLNERLVSQDHPASRADEAEEIPHLPVYLPSSEESRVFIAAGH
ncbi:MAG: hypothetical protein MUE42_07540 [Opitutaceae bacterium]|jgi:hypothetical protein|nr:hypothetical protein [Opitutaceae bacterium]